MGDFPNQIFCSVYISWCDGNSEFMKANVVFLCVSGVHEKSSCSSVE